MLNTSRAQIWRFGMIVLALNIGLGLIVLLQQNFALTAYPLLYAVVAVSAYWGGTKTGLLAALLCTLATSTVLNESAERGISLSWLDLMRFAVFVLLTVLFNRHRFVDRIKTFKLSRNLNFIQQQQDASFAFNQNELFEALQRLNSHVENTPLAIIEWDRYFRVIRWSGQAEAIFGWTAEEIIGKRPRDWNFIVPQDQAAVQTVIEDLINGSEQRNSIQNRNYRRDGTTIVCEWYNSALLDEAGQIESVLSLVLNVTDRVQLEAEQQRLLQLEQAARAEAEQANRLKDEFLAVLSHELRSPLNPILGWSSLLQTKRLSEARSQEALATIERNARLQSQLIEDLLDVSRILQGKLVLNLFPVNLEFIISTALETVRLTADAKAIQIITVLEPNLRQVSGDSARLQQVVWNLLSNAVKFTPERGRIEVRLDRIDSEAQIQVMDTGKGIDPEFLPNVFEYFRQEDGSTTRNFGGLGLGLALVRHIVEQHQGRVWAESEGEGRGATFTVRLPLIERDCQPFDLPVQAPLSQSLEAEPLLGLQILAIDNDPTMRTFVSFALRQAGADVIEADSAVAAIDTLQYCQPDLILSDIGMPEHDGYALLRHIRSIEMIQHLRAVPEAGRLTPAIALTAYAGDDNRQQAIEAGFQKHLAKPVDPQDLIAAIVELCLESSFLHLD